MHFELHLTPAVCSDGQQALALGGGPVTVAVGRNPRARRYILRVDHRGGARVTIPRGGSVEAARQFTENNRAWLERQLRRIAITPRPASEWLMGNSVLFRGEATVILPGENDGTIRFGAELIRVKDPGGDLRPALERYLWKLAARELPARVLAYSGIHRLQVRRISIRDQRSRWGSCSRKATISLNWRLVQAPEFVSDYIILHELMHLRQMNHSARFWREVENVCPAFERAERWLKQNTHLLKPA